MAWSRGDHEHGLSLFIEPNHRVRFRESLTSYRLRKKLRQELAHFHWLDERYTEWVPSGEPSEVAAALRDRGAPATCYLISEDDELDGCEMALVDALAVVLGEFFGTLISCVPGRLAIYSEEPPNKETAILDRRVV